MEDYVHRIGRTGRYAVLCCVDQAVHPQPPSPRPSPPSSAGATGTAVTFFTKRDRYHAKELVRVMAGGDQDVRVDTKVNKGDERHRPTTT